MLYHPMQENRTGDSQHVKCMFSYSNTVLVHLAPLLVDKVLFYCTIPAYAGFDRKVTFENRTGDSQPVRCMILYSNTVGMHLAPLPVVFVHFQYTNPPMQDTASAKRKGDIRKLHRQLTSDSQDVKCIYGYTKTVGTHSTSKSTVLLCDFALCRIWLPRNER